MVKRPLCVATGCYVIGIIMGLYLQISIVFLLCFIIFITVLTYVIYRKIRYVIFIIFLLFGFLCVKLTDNNYFEMYQCLQESKEYKIQGIVVSDVLEKEYKDVYEIEIQKVNDDSKYAGKRCLLQVKKSSKSSTKVSPKLQFGDCIVFEGKVEIPSSARNYMGFDYQKYLKSKGICGTIVAKKVIEVVQQKQSGKLEKIWYDIRENIKEKIYMLLPENARELCLGILIGEKDISEEMDNYFKRSNLTHMLAVSGAHISYIILGVTKLLQKTGYRFRKIFIILFLLFFTGLTEFTPSVQRASFMAILLLLAELLHRKSDIYTSMALSCLILLLYNPYIIFNIGFQLSYGGTIGIVLLQKRISKWLREKIVKISPKVIDALSVTISANLVIIPIMAFQFNTISFTFWLSNLLAGPLLGVIIILGFSLYIISLVSMTLASVIAFPLKYLLYLLMGIAKFCSQISFSSITIRTPFLFEIIIYYIIIFVICYFPILKRKVEIIIYLLSIQVIVLSISMGIVGNHNSLKIYFVDVGQGDCTLICTPTNKTILIDGGGSETGNFDVGEKTLFPYLLDRKITKIDYMMISHFDTDHVRTDYCIF